MDTLSPSLRKRIEYNKRHNRPDFKPCKCRMCKRVVASVSWQGFCPTCSVEKVKRVNKSLREHKGVFYNRWKKGLKAYIKSI